MQSLLNSGKFQVGKLIEHGQSPLHFNDSQPSSYFIRLGTEQGDVLLWSSDFPRAMTKTAPQIGETVVVAYRGIEDVPDRNGINVPRNDWLVAPLKSLHEQAQSGVLHQAADNKVMPRHSSANMQPQALVVLEEAMRQAGIPETFAKATLEEAARIAAIKKQRLPEFTRPRLSEPPLIKPARPSI